MLPLLRSIKAHPLDRFPLEIDRSCEILLSRVEKGIFHDLPVEKFIRDILTDAQIQQVDPDALYFWFLAILAFQNRLLQHLKAETTVSKETCTTATDYSMVRRQLYRLEDLYPENFFG